MDLTNWVCFLIPNIIFGASSWVQIRHMNQRRSSKDVSLWFIGLIGVGLVFTLVLALRTAGSWWLPTERVICVINYAVLFSFAWYWRKRKA